MPKPLTKEQAKPKRRKPKRPGPGRPSGLTEMQAEECGRRIASGEIGIRQAAREYGVSPSVISARFSKRRDTLRTLATVHAETTVAISGLSKSEQCIVLEMSRRMQVMESEYLEGAHYGIQTSQIMHKIAHHQASKLNADAPDADSVRMVAALAQTANQAANMGSALIAANRDKGQDGRKTLEDLVAEAGGGK